MAHRPEFSAKNNKVQAVNLKQLLNANSDKKMKEKKERINMKSEESKQKINHKKKKKRK